MPIYEYRCKKCDSTFEVLLNASDKEPAKCDECGSKRIGRIMSQTSFVLKGSGWYKTDYAGSASSSGSSPSSSSSDSDD